MNKTKMTILQRIKFVIKSKRAHKNYTNPKRWTGNENEWREILELQNFMLKICQRKGEGELQHSRSQMMAP